MFVSEKRVCHQDSREDLGGGVDSGFSRGVQSRTEKSVWLPSRMPSGPTCHYCKKRGHIKAECWKLQSELGRESGSKPVGLVSLGSVSEVRDNDGTLDRFQGFISEGSVVVNGKQSPVVVLRDTGASQSLLVDSVVDLDDATSCNAYVLIQGVGGKFMPVPLHQVELRSKVISGQVTVGVVSTLPVPGVTFILGNDLAGDKVYADPVITEAPVVSSETERLQDEIPGLFPACVVTRSQARRETEVEELDGEGQIPVILADTFFAQVDSSGKTFNHDDLVRGQLEDPDIRRLYESAALQEEMVTEAEGFYLSNAVLMRKWRPRECPADHEWRVVHQVVLPLSYREDILSSSRGTNGRSLRNQKNPSQSAETFLLA